jgi:putative peptide zinc metalloprotease protein
VSVTVDSATGARAATEPSDATCLPEWPRLLDGTELLGPVAGSGLREPPCLVRRSDGQIVQLSRLLYVIASCMDGGDLASVAAAASARLNRRIAPELIAHVAEQKLAPVGLVAHRDGSVAGLERRNAVLALRFRTGILPERVVNVIAKWLRALFRPPVVIAALAALVAVDAWLVTSHGIGAGLKTLISNPALALALFPLLIVSFVFHECGHATACRYSGARPGRIGIGLYLIWPAFYTDVTDSYRLSKAGRLRTDLGGVYFNALFALAAAIGYLATAYKPLLIVVVGQQLIMLNQFIPWMRLDGYHIVSDLIGVSDLFTRIKPVLAGLLPRRRPDPRVTELKPWARVLVTTWVLTTVAALLATVVVVAVNAGSYLRRAWDSLIVQVDGIAHAWQIGSLVDLLSGTIGSAMLLTPVAGIALSYLLLCRRTGASLALHHARRHSRARGRRSGVYAGSAKRHPPLQSANPPPVR